MQSNKKKVDIFVSSYNEENNIKPFFEETKKYLINDNYIFNIVYVDDGSNDKTYDEILKLIKNFQTENIKISVISFIHNFGHEAAMCAGIDMSKSDYAIFMDVDLQNPPNKIIEIIESFEKGADCVLLRRVKYNAKWTKKFFSKAYYLFSKIILRNKNERDVSDFFAINNILREKISKKYNTRIRFLRTFVQNEAKNIKLVDYENNERFSGTSHYDFFKLLKLAISSELSRSQYLRDKYIVTIENPVYIIDKERTIYE